MRIGMVMDGRILDFSLRVAIILHCPRNECLSVNFIHVSVGLFCISTTTTVFEISL